MFLQSPEGVLTFVSGPNTHIFGEPRRFPDICFWCPKLMILESPEGSLTIHDFAEPRRFPDICFWCPKLMFFGEPRRFPDILFLVPQNSRFWTAQKVS